MTEVYTGGPSEGGNGKDYLGLVVLLALIAAALGVGLGLPEGELPQ